MFSSILKPEPNPNFTRTCNLTVTVRNPSFSSKIPTLKLIIVRFLRYVSISGKKASYNPAATLASLKSKREKLHAELHGIENQVYELETKYLLESSNFGNAVKGGDGFLSASKNATK
ncbi:hypothetical protein Acr_22g0001390 [Actinidia rufa]|uniref:Uncharacterized protein n=1 Tax=Actinidia rufa TaxID=165716 RepID=A0A7J0GJ22_9ERIC|nr:hypothetical protein Acr_22g0001390 [Actinidia rufa]